ncbi:hypothetical protein M5X00_13080 [Paenibacillus alvei]|uniref:hypothetical protein n=1 Tax=Paenibacillus alvei TaxID=44250 RepID=UPI000287F6CA|nr:hypothetical protein [Paenibacillus alvei]EJW13815.1 hypothetical protein PAV_109p00450 [Paenibacillus alvei DSM 29]MCY9540541.1 hypothetical protein [Paenibacillus alvei]MCY9708254.1 hypothetical protein [Paenibacillus alvei]MCY9732949.1 hypothetical protein [Paenibacillus alvei]MCY9755174.1 hypothetical protein [Paenibacillus alvei]
MVIQEYWYDLLDDENGNKAYLNTNIEPDLISILEEDFQNNEEFNEDLEEYENQFIAYLRQKGHIIHVVNRPYYWINLGDN